MKPTGILSRQVDIDTGKYAAECAADPKIQDYKRRQQIWKDKEAKRAQAVQVEIDALYLAKAELRDEIHRLTGKIKSCEQAIHNKDRGIVARKNRKEYRSGPCGVLNKMIENRKMVIKDKMMRDAWSKTKVEFQKHWGITEPVPKEQMWRCPTCNHVMSEDESKNYKSCPSGVHFVEHVPV